MAALLGLRRGPHGWPRPDYPVTINTQSPRARGLTTLIYPTSANGNSLVDLVTGKLCTLNAGAVVNTGPYGRQLDCSSGSATVTVNSPIRITTQAISLLAVIVPQVLTRGDLVTRWDTGAAAGDQFNLLYGLTSGKPQVYIQTGGTIQTSGVGATAMVVGKPYTIGGAADGADSQVFLDGVLQASGGVAAGPNTVPTTTMIIGDNAAASGHANAQFLMVAVWNRRLHAGSWTAMGAAPWADLLIRA